MYQFLDISDENDCLMCNQFYSRLTFGDVKTTGGGELNEVGSSVFCLAPSTHGPRFGGYRRVSVSPSAYLRLRLAADLAVRRTLPLAEHVEDFDRN